MYKIKRVICKILFFAMVFSAIPSYIFADNNIIADGSSEITEQADESLENDSETQYDNENDDEKSSENAEILTNDNEETEIPAEEESEIPKETASAYLEEITENSDNVVMYSDLTAEEQKEVKEQYGIRGETFMDCENAGIDLYTTYEIGHALQAAEMSAQEYLEFKSNYSTAEEANYFLEEFANYKYAFPMIGITKDAECKSLFISGVNCINILSAKLIAYLLDSDLVSEYLDITDDEISLLLGEEDYNTYMSVMQEAYGVATVSEYDDESEASRYPQGAFTYDRNGSEVINMTTGAVGYVRTDFTLPGLNGLDLTISSSYDSSLSSNCVISTTGSFNVVERMMPITPLFDFAAGWSFDFSHIFIYEINFKAASTLITASGERYTLSKSDLNNRDKTEISIYAYGEQFKDLTLKKYTGYTNENRTSAYRLDYIDGRTEFFDDTGLILCIRNRFGNEITFEYSTNGYEESDYGQEYNKVEIKDTCGRIVTIERGELGDDAKQETVISVKDSVGVDMDEKVRYKNSLVENTADPKKEVIKNMYLI